VSERPLVLPTDLHPETTESARWLLERVDLLVVDGYNVALRAFPDVDLDAQRRMLLDRLRPLVARGGAQPLVIFDGEGPSGSASRVSGLEVRFSSGTVIADDEIVFVVAATERTVLVVTDDRELRARVRAEGANVVGGPALLGALER
jgi:predicted RNA-binding protein with PIN domain